MTTIQAKELIELTNSSKDLFEISKALADNDPPFTIAELTHFRGVIALKMELLEQYPDLNADDKALGLQLRFLHSKLRFGACVPIPNPYAFKVRRLFREAK